MGEVAVGQGTPPARTARVAGEPDITLVVGVARLGRHGPGNFPLSSGSPGAPPRQPRPARRGTGRPPPGARTRASRPSTCDRSSRTPSGTRPAPPGRGRRWPSPGPGSCRPSRRCRAWDSWPENSVELSKPTSYEPVKVSPATSGWSTRPSPTMRPLPVRQVDGPAAPASSKIRRAAPPRAASPTRASSPRCCRRRAPPRRARRERVGEVPGRDHRPDAVGRSTLVLCVGGHQAPIGAHVAVVGPHLLDVVGEEVGGLLISPSASTRFLPISRSARRRARSGARARRRRRGRASRALLPRRRRQAGYAALAAATASRTSAAVPVATRATTVRVSAGLRLSSGASRSAAPRPRRTAGRSDRARLGPYRSRM